MVQKFPFNFPPTTVSPCLISSRPPIQSKSIVFEMIVFEMIVFDGLDVPLILISIASRHLIRWLHVGFTEAEVHLLSDFRRQLFKSSLVDQVRREPIEYVVTSF